MLGLLARRLLAAVPVLIGISIIVFAMMHLAPGDAADAMLGPLRTEETIRELRHELGLDRPLYEQYFVWSSHAIRGDLGRSVRLSQPVGPEVASKLWRSAVLATAAFTIAAVGGVAAGVVSAVRRGGVVDSLVTVFTVIGVSIPPFFLGMLLILVFAVRLGVLPTSGMYDIRAEASLGQLAVHLVLPAVTLAAAPLAVISRMTRSSTLEVIGQDFVRTARAKGLTERRVVTRHAVRNALIPVVSVFGLQVGYLLSATALVEVVFSWPGLGSLLVQSVVTRDLPLAQGVVLVIALVYVLANILSDFIQAVLDPRIQFQ